ncbi:hypothetical protein [Candidatus Similichlamydia epinepheli]|uniref:hypothetical protein n=1 Tax=Candidatus Similichlamydia epinepheli TaxID=1903953 RepID=UPI000D3CECBE|nr:hypothetical protein [Candidatus Similichlamydia epinepheli]
MNNFSKLAGWFRFYYCSLILAVFPLFIFGFNWPKISEEDVLTKVDTCLDMHAKWNELSPNLIERTLKNYSNYFSTLQSYLDQSLWEIWATPNSNLIETTITQLKERKLTNFANFVHHATEVLEKMQGSGNSNKSETIPPV